MLQNNNSSGFDKNSIIGMVLIVGILIGYMVYTSPSKEDLEKRRKYNDSIQEVTIKKETEAKLAAEASAAAKKQTIEPAIVPTDSASIARLDSAKKVVELQKYGVFAEALKGTSHIYILENELIKVEVNTKGGRVGNVILKDYYTHDKKTLYLIKGDSSTFSLKFSAATSNFDTDSMYFEPVGNSVEVKNDEQGQLAMRLYAGDRSKYIEYVYTLKGNSNIVDFKMNFVGLNNVITSDYTKLNWGFKSPAQEKSREYEQQNTSVYYKYVNEAVDYISYTSDETKKLDVAKLKWISLKGQFFSAVAIAETEFDNSCEVTTQTLPAYSDYVKSLSANLYIPFTKQASESFGIKFYYGPNHYNTLKKFDLDLEKQVPLGWGIFGWVNRLLVIPIFNFLNSFNLNYGIVILILTIILKILLLPIAYRANLSSAKMRVLKPEMDEISKKFEGKDPMEKQQATMALYKKAGINPMAGCVPALLQMPILMALLNFFPSSIELRQQSFLWADDLSSYDNILNLPFNIWGYGNHVSLFALLMTVSTYLYMQANNQLMGGGNDAMQKQMKWVMYLMPIMFLGFLNSRSSGLSYYYFLANMITFGQTFVFRRFIDENKIRATIEDNKKKPAKASGWQARLEKMMKEREQMMKQQRKK